MPSMTVGDLVKQLEKILEVYGPYIFDEPMVANGFYIGGIHIEQNEKNGKKYLNIDIDYQYQSPLNNPSMVPPPGVHNRVKFIDGLKKLNS